MSSSKTAQELIEDAAQDPDLTLEQGLSALMRLKLLQALEGDPLTGREIGEMMEGAAKLLTSGGGGDADAKIYKWIHGDTE